MNASPDLIRQLEASRPTAPAALRTRVREIAARQDAPRARPWLRVPVRRVTLVALPAAAALALVTAGAIGLSRSGPSEALRAQREPAPRLPEATEAQGAQDSPSALAGTGDRAAGAGVATADERAQRLTAEITVEVRDSDAVARAVQDALDLTGSLGGFVVSSSVATGREGSATLVVRVPAAEAQTAIAQLSALGRIDSQLVQVDDLQETLDGLRQRTASIRAQIARITARLESGQLDPETRAALESRRRTLRAELRSLRTSIASTRAEARMATIQLRIATPEVLGLVPAQSRLDRTLDEALNVLAWEGIVALAIAIVVTPFALVALVAWLAQRLYRRREEDRLLAAS